MAPLRGFIQETGRRAGLFPIFAGTSRAETAARNHKGDLNHIPQYCIRDLGQERIAMALGFKLLKFNKFSSSLGLKGTLLLAFGSLAGMAILISAGAGLLLGQLSQTMSALNEKDIPRLTASLQLATLSQSLAAKGPILLGAATEPERQAGLKALKDTQAATLEKLREIDPKAGVTQ